MKKWTEFLVSPQINQKNLAILVFISTNQFYKALQLLLSTQQSDKAYLLLKCMQEMGLISDNSEELDLYKDLQVESKQHLKTAMAGIGFHHITLWKYSVLDLETTHWFNSIWFRIDLIILPNISVKEV